MRLKAQQSEQIGDTQKDYRIDTLQADNRRLESQYRILSNGSNETTNLMLRATEQIKTVGERNDQLTQELETARERIERLEQALQSQDLVHSLFQTVLIPGMHRVGQSSKEDTEKNQLLQYLQEARLRLQVERCGSPAALTTGKEVASFERSSDGFDLESPQRPSPLTLAGTFRPTTTTSSSDSLVQDSMVQEAVIFRNK